MVKKIRRYVYSFWRDPGTWQTDRQTPGDSKDRAYALHRAVKIREFLCLRRLRVAAEAIVIMFSRYRVVCPDVCPAVQCQGGRGGQVHYTRVTCYCWGIRWPPAVFSSLDFVVISRIIFSDVFTLPKCIRRFSVAEMSFKVHSRSSAITCGSIDHIQLNYKFFLIRRYRLYRSR